MLPAYSDKGAMDHRDSSASLENRLRGTSPIQFLEGVRHILGRGVYSESSRERAEAVRAASALLDDTVSLAQERQGYGDQIYKGLVDHVSFERYLDPLMRGYLLAMAGCWVRGMYKGTEDPQKGEWNTKGYKCSRASAILLLDHDPVYSGLQWLSAGKYASWVFNQKGDLWWGLRSFEALIYATENARIHNPPLQGICLGYAIRLCENLFIKTSEERWLKEELGLFEWQATIRESTIGDRSKVESLINAAQLAKQLKNNEEFEDHKEYWGKKQIGLSLQAARVTRNEAPRSSAVFEKVAGEIAEGLSALTKRRYWVKVSYQLRRRCAHRWDSLDSNEAIRLWFQAAKDALTLARSSASKAECHTYVAGAFECLSRFEGIYPSLNTQRFSDLGQAAVRVRRSLERLWGVDPI